MENGNILDYTTKAEPVDNMVVPERITIDYHKENDTCNVIFWALIVFAVLFIMYNAGNACEYFKSRFDSGSSLANKLADAGWTLYMSSTCPWCHRQISELGGSYRYTFDCASQKSTIPGGAAFKLNCAQISGVPAWINMNTGERHDGYQPNDVLAKWVGL
jgi:hypothetical protein